MSTHSVWVAPMPSEYLRSMAPTTSSSRSGQKQAANATNLPSVILDSAASFGFDTRRSTEESSTGSGEDVDGSRLVVFTANHVKSATQGAKDYSEYLAAHPNTLDDITYTLGLRREHLPYRTFAVINHADLQTGGVGKFSSPVKTPSVVPKVVFAFTGQGKKLSSPSFLMRILPRLT